MLVYAFPVVAYLIGSVPMAIVVARVFGLDDPRTTGSHNPGATNILRYGGKAAAIWTLTGDTLKGVIAVLLTDLFTNEPVILAASGLLVFLGHLYPVFFGFQGGKGVATALGVWFTLVPWVGGLLLLTWVTMALLFRYSSLSAIIAALSAPFYVAWFTSSESYLSASIVMSLFLLWRHRGNIRNLVAGTEGRIGR